MLCIVFFNGSGVPRNGRVEIFGFQEFISFCLAIGGRHGFSFTTHCLLFFFWVRVDDEIVWVLGGEVKVLRNEELAPNETTRPLFVDFYYFL
jgi:hypothetical protein